MAVPSLLRTHLFGGRARAGQAEGLMRYVLDGVLLHSREFYPRSGARAEQRCGSFGIHPIIWGEFVPITASMQPHASLFPILWPLLKLD